MRRAGAEQLNLAHGRFRATVAPHAGMTCVSLTRDGEELLWAPAPVPEALAAGRLFGVPLLHPWANRLSSDEYSRLGHRADLAGAGERVRRDPAGRGLHGLRALSGAWSVVEHDTRTVRARLRHGERRGDLEAFPFPHELELELRLEERGLSVTTILTALDGPVPVTYGFHPFLTLPGVERDAWRLELPARTSVHLDAGCLPVGTRAAAPSEQLALAGRELDDAICDLPAGAVLALIGGPWRVAVALSEGFGCAQLFAPLRQPVVSLEPMTAEVDALVSGRGLRVCADTDRTAFTLTIDKEHTTR